MASTSAITSSEAAGSIGRAFAAAREEGRAALIAYTTAGHPTPDDGLSALLAVADAGADVIELGVPFSDPLADGPTIQRSSFRAIEQGVDLAWTLELLARFTAARSTPVVIFSYLNPILDYGIERFLADASAAGAAGLLATDLPAGADAELEGAISRSPLDLIRMIAPTTPPGRVPGVVGGARGFIYYVSRTGITGAQRSLPEGLDREVAALREMTDLPIAVGFGISTPEQASAVARIADGVVVGSALVERLESEGISTAAAFIAALRVAVGTRLTPS